MIFFNSIAAIKKRGLSGEVLPEVPDDIPPDVYDYGLKLSYPADSMQSGWYYFKPHLTANYPNVVCDKKYFFIYSQDHKAGVTQGLIWGKGNNLDLSDFEEVAVIFPTTVNIETPALINIPYPDTLDGRTLHLYYHSNGEPGNNPIQSTRLRVSAGGAELHNMVWDDMGVPLGRVDSNENHTGYFMPYRVGAGSYIGTHITRGGLPQPWYYSTSTNGRQWVRGTQIDTITGIEDGYFAQLSEGGYFYKYGAQWWIGTIHPNSYSGTQDINKKVALAKSDGVDYRTITQKQLLRGGGTNLRNSLYIEGDIAHIYFTGPTHDLYHGKYDLRNLLQWV